MTLRKEMGIQLGAFKTKGSSVYWEGWKLKGVDGSENEDDITDQIIFVEPENEIQDE